MTREAKIGMLTGLLVIVLIGVLLSNYLGQNPPQQMASLPVGQDYRNRVTQPIGVPVSPVETVRDPAPLPLAVAVNGQTNAPTMGQAPEVVKVETPAVPVAMGPVAPAPQVEAPLGVPMFKMPDPTANVPVSLAQSPKPVSTAKEYTIVAGDTLAKIATRFYKSAKPELEQKIVAANPSVLKNTGTMLVVGKKLMIPDVAPAAAPAPGTADAGKAIAKAPVMVHSPGATGTDGGAKPVDAKPISDPAKKETVYVVKAGDTLGSIAAKYVGTGDKSDAAKMVSKIVALNKIKDPASLQVGMKIKLPAKA